LVDVIPIYDGDTDWGEKMRANLDALSTQYANAIRDAALDATTKADAARNDAVASALATASEMDDAILAAAKKYTDEHPGGGGGDTTVFNVKTYGATGNGVTADTAAIQKAIDAAAQAGGGTVYLPAGRYLCNELNLKTYVGLKGAGEATTIVPIGDTLSAVRINGSESLVGDVTADVAMGATSITIANSTGALAAGDIVVLYDAYIYDPNGTSTASGEILEVASVTSNRINLKQQVKGAFTASKAYTVANGTKVRKLNMVVGAFITDLSFEGRLTSTMPLVNTYYAENLLVNNVHCKQNGDNFLSLKLTKSVYVSNTTIENLVDDITNSHFGYGIHASNANEGLTITNVIANNTRHGFTTTGGGKGIPRNIAISNMVVYGSNIAAGIDTHAAADGVTISNCIVTSCAIGIVARGKNITIVGNTVRQCTTGIRIAETLAENVSITSNHVIDTTIGIDSSDTVKNVVIEGNTVRNFKLFGCRVSSPITSLVIATNKFINGDAGGLSIVATSGAQVFDNSFIDMSLVTASFSISIVDGGTGPRIDIHGNKFVADVSTKSSRAVNATRATTVKENTIFGSFTSSTKWNVNGVNQTGNTEYA